VQVDTQSDPHSKTFPSTEKQKDLSKLLAEELQQMGLADVEMDEFGYVYATIPSNTSKQVPVICFCSHVDTAPDSSGTGVKPIVHLSYDGSDILLPDDPTQVLNVEKYPYLKKHIGKDIITASGNTLLGADDKSGVAIIMDLAHYLVKHPELKHGKIRVLFTPDEEVGRGTAKVEMQKLGAEFGYTLDGGELGSLEDETFSADGVKMTIHGVSAHPGDIQGIVASLKDRGIGVLISDHNVEQTLDIVDRAYIMFDGSVQVSGTVEELIFDDIVSRRYFGPTLTARLRERFLSEHGGNGNGGAPPELDGGAQAAGGGPT
jgi:tripeptide aminopeptidase